MPMDVSVRTTSRTTQAQDWALVLEASGVPHRLSVEGERWSVLVPEEEAARAQAALDAYDDESGRDRARLPVVTAVEPIPWIAGLVPAAVLLLLFAITGGPPASSRWVAAGAAAAGKIMNGEPWRTVTALTLHLDGVHVGGNALATAVLVPAIAQRFGGGLGVLLVLLAGIGGNLLSAAAHDPRHVAVGASTATFGAVGILAALRLLLPAPARVGRSKRWIVIAATVLLLAMLGASQGADVLAHLLGLVTGAAIGLVAGVGIPRPPGPAAQRMLIVTVLAIVTGAWWLALSDPLSARPLS